MITAKLRLLYTRILSCIIFLVIFSAGSVAFSASNSSLSCSKVQADGTNTPERVIDCSFGRCGICDPSNGLSSWLEPEAEVVYQVGVYTGTPDTKMPIYRKTMGLGKCKWVGGTRFCVRPTKPQETSYGNSTDRPQVCAYEDPCDGMDPPDGNCAVNSDSGPFHYNTSNVDALSLSSAAKFGGIGIISAGITGTYNQIVAHNVGCIDRKVGPAPPTWSNNAWFNNSLPLPTFVDSAQYTDANGVVQDERTGSPKINSVFESPRIKVKVCKDSSAKIVSCSVTSSVEDATASTVLNPNASNSYRGCGTTNDSSSGNYGRQFCASITTTEPEKIKIVQVTDGEETEVASFDRPGYIPKPTVTESPGSTAASVKMTVTLREQSINLEEPIYNNSSGTAVPYTSLPADRSSLTLTNPTKQAGVLHQVPFSIVRPCVTPPAAGASCTNYQNMVCAVGYDTAPFVGAYKNPLPTGSPSGSIADLAVPATATNSPNEIKVHDVAFPNTNAKKENGAYLQESFRSDVLVYKNSGGDLDRTDPTTHAPIVGKQYLRPATSAELGLCIFTPPDATGYTYTTPGSYTYTVPVNCSQVTTSLWGAGAAGKEASDGGWTGGSGALVVSTLNVQSNDIVNITVGAGGASSAASGGLTRASVTRVGSVIGSVTAGGGLSSGGAATTGTSSGASVVATFATSPGQQGVESDDGWSGYRSGANVCLALSATGCTSWGNGDAGTWCQSGGDGHHGDHQALFGGGGCSQESWHTGVAGSRTYHEAGYSKGGNGKATISCTRGMN